MKRLVLASLVSAGLICWAPSVRAGDDGCGCGSSSSSPCAGSGGCGSSGGCGGCESAPSYEERTVTKYRQEWRTREVPETTYQTMQRWVTDKKKVIENVPYTTTETRSICVYEQVPKEIHKKVTVSVPVWTEEKKTIKVCQKVPKEITRTVTECVPTWTTETRHCTFYHQEVHAPETGCGSCGACSSCGDGHTEGGCSSCGDGHSEGGCGGCSACGGHEGGCGGCSACGGHEGGCGDGCGSHDGCGSCGSCGSGGGSGCGGCSTPAPTVVNIPEKREVTCSVLKEDKQTHEIHETVLVDKEVEVQVTVPVRKTVERTQDITETVMETRPVQKEYTVMVCHNREVERWVESKHCITESVPVTTMRSERYCVSVPYQETIRVPVSRPSCGGCDHSEGGCEGCGSSSHEAPCDGCH